MLSIYALFWDGRNEVSVLDRKSIRSLQDIIGGDRADLVDLIASFLEEAPQILGAMASAGQEGDAATVRRSAHTLKSNARDFGAIELSTRCALLEADLSTVHSLDNLAGRVQEILALWPPARAALEAEMTCGEAEE